MPPELFAVMWAGVTALRLCCDLNRCWFSCVYLCPLPASSQRHISSLFRERGSTYCALRKSLYNITEREEKERERERDGLLVCRGRECGGVVYLVCSRQFSVFEGKMTLTGSVMCY